jgi:hypothetical protein
MKTKPILAMLACLTLLAACSSNDKKEEAADCTFPDAPSSMAPEWVCDEPVNGLELSAVGYADKSAAGINFMKQQAATAARVQLAQVLRVQVQNMIKQYAETTGVGDAETVDRVNTSVTKQITNETLVGSRIYKTRMSPNQNLYVLVGLDAEGAKLAAKNALATSMNNERALWQKFQAEKGQDELAEAIANSQIK